METAEQMRERIKQLEAELEAEKLRKQPKTKGIEFRVEYETGNVQIRRLLPRSINLPSWVLLWLFANQTELRKFIEDNKHLLSMSGDSEETLAAKMEKRDDDLLADNPVVRKPRAENKTQDD